MSLLPLQQQQQQLRRRRRSLVGVWQQIHVPVIRLVELCSQQEWSVRRW